MDNAPKLPYSRRRKDIQNSEASEAKKETNYGHRRLPKNPTPLMLINEISKLFGNHMRKYDDPTLNTSFRHILFHLAHQDGRTQLELANLTHLKPPTVSVSLTKLEADGYVERVTDPRDHRQTRVYLTEKGRDVHRRIHAAIEEIEAKVTQSLSEDERGELVTLLIKLRNNLIGDEIPNDETV
ncbi:MAG: winged helix-turn-helix transcriptional regulator [Clostridia bacterium]|nr:winged helix-turn-helix transcriptional regulator [Clostridia bacterium]